MNQSDPKEISDYPQKHYNQDEISLKDIILKVQEFLVEFWRKKLWILLTCLLSCAFYLYRASKGVTTYTAGLSFMVNEENDTRVRANSPFDPLGFSRVTNTKISELSRSGKIIHEVLLNKEVIEGKNDYLANHLIDIYNLHRKWSGEPLDEKFQNLRLTDFYFSRDQLDIFSPKENRALSIIHNLVSGNNISGEKGILSVSYDSDTEIFRLNLRSLNESLSMRLIENVYEELRKFYVDETVGRPKRTYDLISTQVDSIYGILNATENQVARARDRDRGIISSIPSLNRQELERKSKIIELEYNELLKTQRDLELFLSKETPEFRIIDQTFFPIESSPSKIRALILGFFIGLALSVSYIFFQKIIRDALNS